MSVIDIAEFKHSQKPHRSGRCRCLDCGHEWVAVRPASNPTPEWMECPACGLEKGRPIGPYERSGPHWVCDCGNDLFHIMPQGAYCPNCSTWFTPDDAVGALTEWAANAMNRFVQDLGETAPGAGFGTIPQGDA
jgi:hypothetical protein